MTKSRRLACCTLVPAYCSNAPKCNRLRLNATVYAAPKPPKRMELPDLSIDETEAASIPGRLRFTQPRAQAKSPRAAKETSEKPILTMP